MTKEQEKAKEITEKFYSANQPFTFEIKAAKQCALICVDELIEESYGMGESGRYKYWQKVRQEIEKL